MTTVDGRKQSESTVVKVRDANLDAAAAPWLRAAAERGTVNGSTLILDLSVVEFADSSGLGALCSLSRDAGPGGMAFVGVSRRLRRILARVPAHRLPAIYDALEDALIALGTTGLSGTSLLSFG